MTARVDREPDFDCSKKYHLCVHHRQAVASTTSVDGLLECSVARSHWYPVILQVLFAFEHESHARNSLPEARCKTPSIVSVSVFVPVASSRVNAGAA